MSSKRKSNSLTNRKTGSSIINFLSLVVGFTVMSIILLMAYNYFFGSTEIPTPSADSSSGSELGDAQVEKALLSDDLSSDAFAKKIAIAQRSDLVDFLERANKLGPGNERVPVRIERNRRRVKAAEQLLMHDCTDEEYALAIKSKLLALSSIYNTSMDGGFQVEVTEEADELRKFAKTISTDEDKAIRLDARLTIAGIDLIESAKLPEAEQDTDQVVSAILQLLKDFPDETKVANYVQAVFPAILKIDASYAVQLAEKLFSHAGDFKQEHQGELFRNLYDMAVLAKTEAIEKMANVFVGGDEGKRELVSIAKDLASDVRGGEVLINQLELMTHWLEQERELASALEIYGLLLESALQRPTSGLKNKADKAGRDGKARCALVGKKLELQGERLVGGPLVAEQYDSHFVVVLFLSFERFNAEALLNDVSAEFESLANRRVKFIVITLDTNPHPDYNILAARFPSIEFLKRGLDDAQPPSIFMQYPAHIVPQAILINPEGVLIRSGLKPQELSLVVNEEQIKFEKR